MTSDKVLYAQFEGTVEIIKRIGNQFEVMVLSTDGKRKAQYHSLDIVSVVADSKISLGQLIGYQYDSSMERVSQTSTSSSGCSFLLTKEDFLFFMGNGTMEYQNDILKNAVDVLFFREGAQKNPNINADSFTFYPAAGKIATNETMEVIQRFALWFRKLINDNGYERIYFYGNNSNTYFHQRMKGALEVYMGREGFLKTPGLPDDSYTVDLPSGILTTTEVMMPIQRFYLLIKRA